MTSAHLHLDRTASAWLISRFVDPGGDIEFLEWGEDPPSDDGLTIFGVPGAQLGPYDEDGTCYAKLLRRYELEDPALALLGQMVDAGVRNALALEPIAGLAPDLRAIGIALDLVGTGLGVDCADDVEHLRRATPFYDALYRVCQMRTLPEEIRRQVPRTPGERSAFLREVLAT